MYKQVYIALGGNIGDTEQYFALAKEQLQKYGLKILASSTTIKTKAYGYEQQADFLNAVLLLETQLEPLQLLTLLKGIEKQLGRVSTIRWGERCIDLDIIFYDDIVCNLPQLTIPHADLQNREFVLGPLLELAPEKVHPVLQKTIKELYQQLKGVKDDE